MTEKKNEPLRVTTFDDIFDHIGQFGRYQLVLQLIIGLMAIPLGWHNLTMSFVSPDHDHWCRVPALSALNDSMQKYVSIPMEKTRQGAERYDRCNVYNIDYNVSRDDIEKWNRTVRIKNATKMACNNGWTFDKSIFTSTVNSEWNLVCDDAPLVPLIGTIFMGGVFFGAVMSGAVGDRFGRKVVIFGGIILQGAFTIGGAFIPNYAAYCVFRFFVAAFAIASYTSAFVMALEIISGLPRVIVGCMFQAWFSTGYILLTGFAFAIRSHVYLQVALGAATLVFGLPAIIFLPESPRWLLSVGRKKECIAILQRIAKANGKELTDEIIFEDIEQEQLQVAEGVDDQKAEHKPSILDLFKTPNLRKNTLIIWFVWFVNSLVYYGLSMGVGSLVGSIHLNAFLNAVVEIPAFFLNLVLMLKVGRRLPLVGFMIFCGLATLATIPLLSIKGLPAVLMTLSLLGKMGISVSFAIVYVYSAEVFPTPIRNVGVGGASSCARISSMVAPQIGPLRETVWVGLPAVIFGGFSLAAGVASFFLPETHNKKLPDTIEEGEAFGKKTSPQATKVAAINPAFDGSDHPNDVSVISGYGAISGNHEIKPQELPAGPEKTAHVNGAFDYTQVLSL